jgi:hypothetical protein
VRLEARIEGKPYGFLLDSGASYTMLNWRRTDTSLIVVVVVGTSTAVLWQYLGLSVIMNEAAPGIVLAISANFIVSRLSRNASPALSY